VVIADIYDLVHCLRTVKFGNVNLLRLNCEDFDIIAIYGRGHIAKCEIRYIFDGHHNSENLP
jgi:hypothetical protein